MSWSEKTVGDLVELQRGHDLPDSARKPGTVPVIGSAGLTGYHNVAKSKGPGVTLGRSGASIGKVTYVLQDFWPHNACLYVKNFKGNDPRFVSYLLKTVPLAQLNSGAAQPSLNRNFVYGVKIKFPGLMEQLRVVEILGKYDDLIENNKRRIALLEESARQLYKEWFVRFRFPGHEHVKIIDGVPEGWSFKPLKEIAKITMGQSPKSQFYNSDGDGLPFHQGVTKFGFRFVDHETYCTKPTRLSQPGDILFSVRAPVGRMNITNDVIILGRGLSAIHSIDDFQSFLFYALKSYFFKEDMIGGGAIYASVTKKDMENQELLIPSKPLLNEFNDFGSDVDKQIYNLHQLNVNLTRARDMLLPKLMSGEISV